MKSAEEYKAIFYRQLALDYCCRPEDILSGRNQFHVYRPLEGRRQFRTGEDCLLKAASVRGRILITGRGYCGRVQGKVRHDGRRMVHGAACHEGTEPYAGTAWL